MNGLAKVRRFDFTGNEVAVYEGVESSLGGTLATLAVPIVVTLAGSYYITRKAYPRDFTFFKWVGVPIFIGGLGLLASIATGLVVSKYG